MLERGMMLQKLQEIGIVHGDVLLVHSSLRAIGPVDGRADGLLNALCEAVGTDGTVVMPTFNYETPQPFFDPNATPSRTGMLCERLRQRTNAVRSLHPTHSDLPMIATAKGLAFHDLIRAIVTSALERLEVHRGSCC